MVVNKENGEIQNKKNNLISKSKTERKANPKIHITEKNNRNHSNSIEKYKQIRDNYGNKRQNHHKNLS